ncbi:MAG: polyisoprenoid-binding protein [bacterium]|nr:MAG: polyisoprenoid-binding protein [bacterium]
MKKLLSIITFQLLLVFTVPAFAANYTVDSVHSNIGFSVRHLVISNVKWSFTDVYGSFTFDEKKVALKDANLTIKAKSISTNEPKRDGHLRSPEFLNTDKYPTLTFKMKKSGSLGGKKMWVTGDLTIAGVTREIRLEGEYIGAAKDPWGNFRAGFTAEGKINRFDYGLKWNKAIETGGMVVGKEVRLIIEVEGIRKK